MNKPFRAARMAALLLTGTALTLPALPALASSGQILTMDVGQSRRAPLVPGQQVTTTSAATQVIMTNGTILSFVQGGSFTVGNDGILDIHAGNATVLAAREPITVRLPGGGAAALSQGASGNFTIAVDGFTGSVLTGRVDVTAAGSSRSFDAGQAWQATGGQAPDRVFANAAQAVPAVASQRQAGIAAAAANGQPVGLGQALAAVGASGDVVAAATRLQASAQNPALASFPAADAATLANYAASLASLYGAPAFQGAGPDLVRTYLSYLGQGGLPGDFQAAYGDLVSRYLELLRAGGVPADFAGASETAINAYLEYIRSTGALSSLSEPDRALIGQYLSFLRNGGAVADFTALYTQAISAFLEHVKAGGLPSAYAGLSLELVRQYLEMLQSTGLLQGLLGAQAEFLTAYLAYLQTGADPDTFPGLPEQPVDPVDPENPPPVATPIRVAGSTVAILPDRDVHMPIGAQEVGFVDGMPESIPDGRSIIVTDEATFADVHVDDRFFIGRLTNGKFRQFQRDHILNADQGVHYAYLRTDGTTLPAGGTVTYGLVAATRPTFASGASAAGTFDAKMAVAWGAAPKVGLAGTLAMPGDATYAFTSDGGVAGAAQTGITLSGYGQNAYQFNSALTGTGRACTGGDCGIRFLMQPGGPDAQALAVTYATSGGDGLDRITGAAGFAAMQDPGPGPEEPGETPPVSNARAYAIVAQTSQARAMTVTQQVVTVSPGGLPTRIGNYDVSGASLLDRQENTQQGWEIGRFGNGAVALGSQTYTLGTGQAAHFALAGPLSNIPTDKRIDYSLHAYSKPTYADGSAIREARLDGRLAVIFGRNTWGYQASLALIDDEGARNYNFGLPGGVEFANRVFTINNGVVSLEGLSSNLTTDDARCTDNACRVQFNLVLGGDGAENAAGAYQINRGGQGQTNGMLSGAVLFRDIAKGGGIVDPVTGTERTNQFVVYAGSAIGIDQRDKVTTTTQPDGTLDKYVWTINPKEAPQRGSNQSLETGTAGGIIGWSRWADGITAGNYHDGPQFARSGKQGMHLVHGDPATGLPTGGTVTYTLAGATSPTIRDGSADPGTMTGSAAVAFGSTARVGLDMMVTIGGHGYAVATNGGVANPGASQIAVGADMGFRANDLAATAGGPACTGTTCTASVTGFLAGTGASHIGISYTINGGTFDKQVDGAAVFGR
ncbi:hypothetical protein [Niveispirillum fermenti]|uniref:hypothetical protein n=1 Tax=Niveispirillum fermenti TaxID=1233113 RepID=UPI0040412AD4